MGPELSRFRVEILGKPTESHHLGSVLSSSARDALSTIRSPFRITGLDSGRFPALPSGWSCARRARQVDRRRAGNVATKPPAHWHTR